MNKGGIIHRRRSGAGHVRREFLKQSSGCGRENVWMWRAWILGCVKRDEVNGRTEALDEGGGVIPGLYAAGDVVVAETYGDPPILGQGTLDFALSSGRVSGVSALAYLEGGEW